MDTNRECRPKTNSITHLVKIVAKEVFEEEMKKIKYTGVNYEKLKEVFCAPLDNGLQNLGRKWNDAEDELLKAEINFAINKIAENHGRTFGAIISRSYQKEFFREK